MAFVLESFFFCIDLKLGAIIMAFWGMIFSGISIVSLVLALLFNKGSFPSYFPVHFNTGSTIATSIIALILLIVYFYFSYMLLMGAQNGDAGAMVGYLIIHGIFVIVWIVGMFANVGSLIMAILYIYLWFCVYSFYVKCGGRGVA